MQRSVKKLSLLLIALVLGMGLLCAFYGAFRFTGMFWYPNRSSVKDVDIEIITRSSPSLLCLKATSLVVTEDQGPEVIGWYRQQGWELTKDDPRRYYLWWQPLSPLHLGPVEIDFLNTISFYRRAALMEIYTESPLCVSW
jgi:hypothetical protein